MKAALEGVGLKRHFICQPLAMWLPDAEKIGWVSCPEFPFGKVNRRAVRQKKTETHRKIKDGK